MTKGCRSATHWDGFVSTSFNRPHVTRGQVHDLAINMLYLRNRCAQLEPVFSSTFQLSLRMGMITELGNLLSSKVVDWVGHHSEVTNVLNQCPVPSVRHQAATTGYMNT